MNLYKDFEGFEPANTTPVPDILFDELLPELNEAQLKVMLYIIRRTLGFKKTADAISLRQFRYGITTKDKRQLDKGCGLKNFTTISKALKSLEAMNCIERATAKTDAGDDDTTVYRIKFRGTTANVVPTTDDVVGYYSKRSTGTTQEGAGVLRETEPQLNSNTRDSSQETVKQEEESAPANIRNFEEEKKKRTDPHMPAMPKQTTTVPPASLPSLTGTGDGSNSVQAAIAHDSTHPPVSESRGAMALTPAQIQRQIEQRVEQIFAIYGEEIKRKPSRSKQNKDGALLLAQDDVTDADIRKTIQAIMKDAFHADKLNLTYVYNKLDAFCGVPNQGNKQQEKPRSAPALSAQQIRQARQAREAREAI